jgi:hypothetical protein
LLLPPTPTLIIGIGLRSILATDPPHEHFTRLQRAQGVMDPQLKLILDEIVKTKDELSYHFED